MIIGVCGYGSSGSSAVIDLLKEHAEKIQALDDEEFILPYCPDGILSLKESLFSSPNRGINSGVAIERFMKLINSFYVKSGLVKSGHITKKNLLLYSKEFIDSITMLSWNGYDGTEPMSLGPIKRLFYISFMMQRVIPSVERKLKRNLYCKPYRNIRFSVCPPNYDENAKKYIKSIISDMGGDFDRKIVLDQPFSGDNPISVFPFFDNPKAIIVDRDPRDVYLFAKLFLRNRGRFIPTNSVQNFVEYYKTIRRNKTELEKNPNVLFVQFEDLVFCYEDTAKKIENFCELDVNPNPKSIFVPEMSAANTRLFLKFKGFESEIKYIEKELSSFLFPFEKYGEKQTSGEMFFGRSPLNKK